MKTILLLTLLYANVLLCTFTCKAQNKLSYYVSVMDTAESATTWNQLSIDLDALALKEKNNWLVQYHASFATALSAMRINEMQSRDQQLDKALALVERADKLKADESENYILRGMITAMKISVDPSRGMEMGQESSMLLKKGRELNPENPRAYLELGESAMYVPEQYGGGKEKALRLLNTSLTKYKTFKSQDPLWPKWGEKRANTLYEKCKSL
jgi:hypothetical protein